MGTKIKGIYKGFKFISQIFVVKEREMEIGYPTDVKHVAHIGWDGSSGTAPGWMNEFKTTSDFAATSLGSFDAEGRDSNSNALSTWSSQDFEQSMGGRQAAQVFKDSPIPDIPNVPKKHKRRKSSKSSSSPRSSSSTKHTRGSKSKGSNTEIEVIHGMQLRMC